MDLCEIALISVVALSASALTLISGFGLGTILLPTFILFFSPLEAVMLTAIVHVLNNVFKISMLFKLLNIKVLMLFGLPAILGAYFGSWLATRMDGTIAYTVSFGGEVQSVSFFTLVVAILMILFSIQELIWGRKALQFKSAFLLPGGVISGFFGGLTGHQGALRSMFLLKSGLTTSGYVATGAAIAMLIDLTRIPRYLLAVDTQVLIDQKVVLISATLFAFLGAFIGKRLMKKVTFRSVQWTVGILMMVISIGLLTGLLS